MRLNIIGGIFGTDGYSSHTRSLANALYKVADCRITTNPVPNWERLVNDNELKMITKPERKEDYNLIVAMPHQWKMLMDPGKNIGYVVWEGDKVPLSWIDEFLNEKIDYIFVPSTHTYNAIINTAANDYEKDAAADLRIEEKLHIIPHGVDHKLFYSQQPEVIACQGEGEISGKTPIEESGTSSQYPSADKDALTKPVQNVVAASRIEGRLL